MQPPVPLLSTVTYPPGATNSQARIVIDGVRGAIFVYENGGPLGALIGSWAITAGTDPYGNVYPQGLSVSVGMITGSQFIITGTSSGIFVYQGVPGLGNPPIASISLASTDPYGNPIIIGIVSYLNSLSPVPSAVQLYGGFINYFAFIGGIWTQQITQERSNIGTANEGMGWSSASASSIWEFGQGEFNILAGGLTVASPGETELNGFAFANAGLQVNGSSLTATAGTITNLSSVSTDTWHAISNPAGFTGTIRVKRLTETNTALLDINLTFTTTVAGAQYNTGGISNSAYFPTAARYAPLVLNQAYTAQANAVPRVEVTAAGGVALFMPAFAAAGNTTIVVATFMYPLD